MKNKIILALASSLIVVGLAGCGGNSGSTGELELVTDIETLNEGDVVVMATSLDEGGLGVTGWNENKDATISEDISEWAFYTVELTTGGVLLYDASAEKYVAPTAGTNAFKYGDNGATINVNENGEIYADFGDSQSYFYRNENGGSPVFRFYKAAHAGEEAYTPFCLYVVC